MHMYMKQIIIYIKNKCYILIYKYMYSSYD